MTDANSSRHFFSDKQRALPSASPKRRAIGIITAFKRAEILEGTGLESFRLLERKEVDSRTRRNTHSQEKPMKSLNQLAEINRLAHILEESGQ